MKKIILMLFVLISIFSFSASKEKEQEWKIKREEAKKMFKRGEKKQAIAFLDKLISEGDYKSAVEAANLYEQMVDKRSFWDTEKEIPMKDWLVVRQYYMKAYELSGKKIYKYLISITDRRRAMYCDDDGNCSPKD